MGLILYLSVNGYMVSYADWHQTDHGDWRYETEDSRYYTGWKNMNGQWYYFDQTGWLLDGGDWYYLSPDGSMKSNCWVDGYYLSSSGKMVSNQISFADFSNNEQFYLYTMASLAYNYHFTDASYMTDTERNDIVVASANFTYGDALGGIDILPAKYNGGFMWADENAFTRFPFI